MKKVKKICEDCGKEFMVIPQHVKTRKRCLECQQYIRNEYIRKWKQKKKNKEKDNA